MSAAPIPTLYDLRGIPLASPACLARVRKVDANLGVIYVEGVLGGYWALTERWRDRDPRRAHIQAGTIAADHDFDVKHIFPRTMPMESVAAHVENNWGHRAVPDAAKTAAQLVDAAKKKKADDKEHKMDVFLDRQEQQVKDMSDHERRVIAGAEAAHPMVAGFGDGTMHTGARQGKRKAPVGGV